MKLQVTAIVESFEREEITEVVALARIRKLTGRGIDGDWLRNYWRSESVEDFVDRLCAEPIRDWERITDEEALALMAEYLETQSPGRRDSIEEALDRRFGKPAGTLSDLVFQRDFSDPDSILEELRRDTRIYL
ncbi:MAG: hypothetical protein R2747_13390 [Pyrinomonadaceae bacterium]